MLSVYRLHALCQLQRVGSAAHLAVLHLPQLGVFQLRNSYCSFSEMSECLKWTDILVEKSQGIGGPRRGIKQSSAAKVCERVLEDEEQHAPVCLICELQQNTWIASSQ